MYMRICICIFYVCICVVMGGVGPRAISSVFICFCVS